MKNIKETPRLLNSVEKLKNGINGFDGSLWA